MHTENRRMLLVASGIAALVGAVMWAYKSVVILVTGDHPTIGLSLLSFGLGFRFFSWRLRLGGN